MFVIEWVARLPALTLSPAVAVAAGMVIRVQGRASCPGSSTSGPRLNFVTAIVMPLVPEVSILLFGAVSAVSFFVPGLKYYRQRKARLA